MPIIISSDKTQLTQFRGKLAYPVYLTIGNILKHIRRKPSRQAQVLLAYLPTSKLDHIKNKASRRRCMSNLFHHCMQVIVKPLESAGHNGIILVSGDGAVRRCFPILAAYVQYFTLPPPVSLDSTGVRRSSPESTRLRQSSLESGQFQRTPAESGDQYTSIYPTYVF